MKPNLLHCVLILVIAVTQSLHAADVLDVEQATIRVLTQRDRNAFPEQGIELQLSAPVKQDVDAWHFRTGVPFAFGSLQKSDSLALYRDGKRIPLQVSTIATWGPGSPGVAGEPGGAGESKFGDFVKWLRLDFIDSLKSGEKPTWRLVRESKPRDENLLQVSDDADTIRIDNGVLNLVINKRAFNIFDSVKVDGRSVVTPGQMRGAYLSNGDGNVFHAHADKNVDVQVEHQGPLAAIVRAEGWFVNPSVQIAAPTGEPVPRPAGGFCRFVTRIYVAANQPDVRVQHTFILTEDSNQTTYGKIGIALPAADAATFGGVQGQHAGPVYLLQDHFDRFALHRDGQLVTEGSRAPGWMQSGDLAVAVRDFWQNYPNELELVDGEMRVHFWPANGAKRVDQTPELNDDNAWRLPWVHSGKLLDFRSPQALRDKASFPGQHGGGYVDLMYNANALGVAKTHDLLISFKAGDTFADRADTFQHNPHALPDPHHVAATQVFGDIPAVDFEKRPLTERRYLSTMHWIMRSKDAFGSFGMWNFGDLNTSFLIDKDGSVSPSYRRLWTGSVYNFAVVPWLLYWRSGDHAIGQHARRHSRHIMDVDSCHWTNDRFNSREAQPTYHQRKAVGGMGDLRAVHWHAGDLKSYHSAIDFMLYDFYLTGNRRAWDVANAHGEYVANGNRDDLGREVSAEADTLIEYYKATWRPELAESVRQQVQLIINQPIGRHRGKLSWRPWIGRFLELTGDPATLEYLLRWVEEPTGVGLAQTAAAWRATGDERYARQCARQLLVDALTTVVRDDEHDGMYGRRMNGWASELNNGLYALTAADHAQQNLRDFQPQDEWPYFSNWGLQTPQVNRESAEETFGGTYPWPSVRDPDPRYLMTAYVYHDGAPKRLWLGVQNTQAKPGCNVRLFAPDGTLLKDVHLENFDRAIRLMLNSQNKAVKLLWPRRVPEYDIDGDEVTIDGKAYPINKHNKTYLAERPFESVEDLYALCSEPADLGPADAKGFYRVEYAGLFYTPVPLLPPGGKAWLAVGEASTMRLSDSMQFFYVPPDVSQFRLSFLPASPDTFHASGAVLNPDAKPVASISCGRRTEPQVIDIDVAPEHRGRVWAVAGSWFSIVGMEGLPAFISPSYDAVATEPHFPPVHMVP